MKIVIRQATILDPASPYHNQKTDLAIHDGVITAIGNALDGTFDVDVARDGLFVSPGWVDVFSHFCDPGFEARETLETGSAAAAAGGYTDVFLLPNTLPFVHNKAAVQYLVQQNHSLPVTIHPIGAITKNGEGKELAEMYDMHRNGARAFSDGLQGVQNAGLLVKALQYLKAIDVPLIQVPDDRTLNNNGLMHEGIVSTTLGLPGKPAVAEELMVARDIELAKHTGSKIHLTGISTAKSVALITQAKADGVAVTCSVTPYHLAFCDADLKTYDTNLKVTPPLRPAADRAALQEAVRTGVIDCIATHHLPQNRDEKLVEFEYAADGMLGLQTSAGVVTASVPELTPEAVVRLFSTNPRSIFGLYAASIQVGATASLTLFQNPMPWFFTPGQNKSKSNNTPFYETPLGYRPLGIIHKDSLHLNEEF